MSNHFFIGCGISFVIGCIIRCHTLTYDLLDLCRFYLCCSGRSSYLGALLWYKILQGKIQVDTTAQGGRKGRGVTGASLIDGPPRLRCILVLVEYQHTPPLAPLAPFCVCVGGGGISKVGRRAPLAPPASLAPPRRGWIKTMELHYSKELHVLVHQVFLLGKGVALH